MKPASLDWKTREMEDERLVLSIWDQESAGVDADFLIEIISLDIIFMTMVSNFFISISRTACSTLGESVKLFPFRVSDFKEVPSKTSPRNLSGLSHFPARFTQPDPSGLIMKDSSGTNALTVGSIGVSSLKSLSLNAMESSA
jgi:hypothetical protein